jgi:hypothetical protein
MNSKASEAHSDDTQGHDADPIRRALIHAGWLVPVIIAVKLPSNAFAQYASVGVSVVAPPISAGVGVTVTGPLK